MPSPSLDAQSRLAAINEAREKARAMHPDAVAFLEYWRSHFPEGEGHFYPKGLPIYERSITGDKMALTPKRSKR